MEKPRLVDRPELIGGNEFLQALQGGDTVRCRPARRQDPRDGTYFPLNQYVGGRQLYGPSMIMPSQMRSPLASLAKDETVSTIAFCQCNSERILWYSLRTGSGGRPSLPLAQMNTDACGRSMRICERRLCGSNAMVLFAPLVPFLPLIAAHPTEHQRNALFVRELDNVLTGDLRFPAQHVHPEVFHIPQDFGFALRIVPIQQVRGVISSAHQEVSTVDLEIEISALALIGELLVLIAVLGNAAYSEANVRAVRDFLILHKLQTQVIEGRLRPWCTATRGRDCLRPSWDIFQRSKATSRVSPGGES